MQIKTERILEFKGNFVFFNIAKQYRDLKKQYSHDIPADELYKATHRAWIMAEQKLPAIQYAAAVCGGIIRAVYEVKSWERDTELPDRWKFIGILTANQPQVDYVGKPADPYMPRTASFVKAYNFLRKEGL